MVKCFIDELFELVANRGPDDDVNEVMAGLFLVAVNLMFDNCENNTTAEKMLKAALNYTIKEVKK